MSLEVTAHLSKERGHSGVIDDVQSRVAFSGRQGCHPPIGCSETIYPNGVLLFCERPTFINQ
jgi:hypothetical protein